MADSKARGKRRASAAAPSLSKKAKQDPAVVKAKERVEKLEKEKKDAQEELKTREKEAKKAAAGIEKQKKQEAAAAKKKKDSAAKEKRQAEVAVRKAVKQAEDAVKAEKKQWKQNWNDYWQAHDVAGETFDAEPEDSITQTDAGTIYRLTPKELGCLRHFPDYIQLYKKTRKLFDQEEVKPLAFRKYAMCAGVSDRDEILLSRGQELWEEEGHHASEEDA
ncbi:hypothetical protein CC80DRAFT_249741 [Byssothecium circinans]|uniref:Uncharacterized protein n=1 Tax=Byssothecium circinans TaxID=147558 RepID=A0A6A5TDZ9_9PLEO|nr:hypothetical protein CC80DRAFT_249741 [Byssothecium circinans]